MDYDALVKFLWYLLGWLGLNIDIDFLKFVIVGSVVVFGICNWLLISDDESYQDDWSFESDKCLSLIMKELNSSNLGREDQKRCYLSIKNHLKSCESTEEMKRLEEACVEIIRIFQS